MHAVARRGPILGLLLTLLTSSGWGWAVTAVVGQPAPQILLPSIYPDADPVDLAAYQGKVVYVDFWSSWCAPCRRAMPHLDALRQAFPRSEFEVISVNVDPVIADGRRFLEQVSVSYPVAVDAAGTAVRRFGVDRLPSLILIDRAGVVREVIQGQDTENYRQLEKRVAMLVEGDGIR